MRLAPGLQHWQEYVEKVGTGEMNNQLDQVEIRHVNITREVDDMINVIFPDLCHTNPHAVILATLNATINTINSRIIDAAPGAPTFYYSIDHAIRITRNRTILRSFSILLRWGVYHPTN